jgi:uncharacterized protein (TIGR02588 family)
MRQAEKNWLEWSVFGVSFVLVAAVVGYLVWDAVTLDVGPPLIEASAGQVVPFQGSWIVEVQVRNAGSQTAGSVAVEVSLFEGGEAVETGEFSVVLLPRGSTRHGWVMFGRDPAKADQIEVSILGYDEP